LVDVALLGCGGGRGTATIRAKKTSILFSDFKSSHIHWFYSKYGL